MANPVAASITYYEFLPWMLLAVIIFCRRGRGSESGALAIFSRQQKKTCLSASPCVFMLARNTVSHICPNPHPAGGCPKVRFCHPLAAARQPQDIRLPLYKSRLDIFRSTNISGIGYDNQDYSKDRRPAQQRLSAAFAAAGGFCCEMRRFGPEAHGRAFFAAAVLPAVI